MKPEKKQQRKEGLAKRVIVTQVVGGELKIQGRVVRCRGKLKEPGKAEQERDIGMERHQPVPHASL